MSIFSLAFWMRIHLVVCVIETKNVEYKYFSTGEEITLKCKCVASYWIGPALNTVNSTKRQISQIEITDMNDNPKRWNMSIYTKGGNIANTLPPKLVKRLSLLGANFDLHITNLSSSDEGLYICETAINCALPQYRYLLYTKYKPSIKVNVKENIIVEGETVDLYCATRNNHTTTSISWYAGNKKLISTSESSLNYKMSNVSRFDTGNYTCSVQNEIGNTSSGISLVISCKTFFK
ncbi:unnamed protein product [Mytilus coruscus]|uniref:Ig-like domain-containing protein n=1 Tax=Mytilus coruscus TaxID=42192 RepID=A0A6J8AHV5_MYTCO|nr:unnamed protein product [Mytilus coruscus]